ncbi:MAG TPA: DJ-1/PfpI family protein [Terriglobia bacterium]|nr:DJ-1/PfpI family protein [Terriglobia bacterium]
MADTKLTGKKVLMIIPPTQFRDEEFFEPKAILEREGAVVQVASTSKRTCYGMKGGVIDATLAIAEARADDYDALVLCGGSSAPEFLWNDKKLHELTAAMASQSKIVAAISLATVVLAKAKLLEGRQATVYFLPQAVQELKNAGATVSSEPLVIQDRMILAEGPRESTRFGEAILQALAS